MGFPPDVAEKALLECGRSCCICRKFRGPKIELHHIVQKSEGGTDTYENCIPLCFDCHAEVKAYNPNHPKGKQYTNSELKQHRDRWYETVKNNQLTTTIPEQMERDWKSFIKIQKIGLPVRPILGTVGVIIIAGSIYHQVLSKQQLTPEPQATNLSHSQNDEFGERLACGVTDDPNPPTRVHSEPDTRPETRIDSLLNNTPVEIYERRKELLRIKYRKKGTTWGWTSKKLIRKTVCH